MTGHTRQLGVYSEVLQRIRSEYVEEPNFETVKSGALQRAAGVSGCELKLSDAGRIQAFQRTARQIQGEHRRDGFQALWIAAIVSVILAAQRTRQALRPGDIIESLEGRSTRDISLAEILKSLPGEKDQTSYVDSAAAPGRTTEGVVTRDEVSAPGSSTRWWRTASDT